jgi:hypothetical protein
MLIRYKWRFASSTTPLVVLRSTGPSGETTATKWSSTPSLEHRTPFQLRLTFAPKRGSSLRNRYHPGRRVSVREVCKQIGRTRTTWKKMTATSRAISCHHFSCLPPRHKIERMSSATKSFDERRGGRATAANLSGVSMHVLETSRR